MAIRPKIIRNSQQFLEPGEQIQAVLAAQTASQWLVLLGLVFFFMINNYRCVVATDRRILVLESGKLILGNPKSIKWVLPRYTRIGPASGLIWYRTNALGEVLRIHKRFFKDIAQADAWAWTQPPAGTLLPPPPPPPPPAYSG